MLDISQVPGPFDKRTLSRASVVGISLAIGGIVLFIVLWVILGRAEVNQFVRLLLSICIPPGLMAALLGGYFLFVQPRNK